MPASPAAAGGRLDSSASPMAAASKSSSKLPSKSPSSSAAAAKRPEETEPSSILPDDMRREVRPEDLLPFFQYPRNGGGVIGVPVPASAGPANPAAQLGHLPSTMMSRLRLLVACIGFPWLVAASETSPVLAETQPTAAPAAEIGAPPPAAAQPAPPAAEQLVLPAAAQPAPPVASAETPALVAPPADTSPAAGVAPSDATDPAADTRAGPTRRRPRRPPASRIARPSRRSRKSVPGLIRQGLEKTAEGDIRCGQHRFHPRCSPSRPRHGATSGRVARLCPRVAQKERAHQGRRRVRENPQGLPARRRRARHLPRTRPHPTRPGRLPDGDQPLSTA
jgi:hypothetical protein